MSVFDWKTRLSAQGRRTDPPEISWLMAQALEVPGLISLAAGFVDRESLPHLETADLVQRLLSDPETGRAALQYGTTQGDSELRELLVQRLCDDGALHPASSVDASNTIVGSGSQQLLYLAVEALIDEGDIVLMEAPTYFVVLGALKSQGARTIGIDTDENGIVPEQLQDCLNRLEREGQLNRIKMLYLMSYATNPQGVTLSNERRKVVLDIARRYRDKGYPFLILEDAAYRQLGFDPELPPPIKSYEEENELVLFTESFSKSLSPGFRLGYAVGPKTIVDKMIDLKGNHDFGSSNLTQQLMKSVLRSGLFDRHVAELRKVYHRKANIVLDRLTETFPQEAAWLRPRGGLYTWVTLPPGFDTGPNGPVFKAALEEKVLYVPGALCFSGDRRESKRTSTLRLSYGMIEDDALREGCDRLGRALERVMDECAILVDNTE